jgi:hypothetical protein
MDKVVTEEAGISSAMAELKTSCKMCLKVSGKKIDKLKFFHPKKPGGP